MAELYGDLPGGREADLVPDPEGEVWSREQEKKCWEEPQVLNDAGRAD